MVITQNISAGDETAESAVGGGNVVQRCKGSQAVNTVHSPLLSFRSFEDKNVTFSLIVSHFSKAAVIIFIFRFDCFY